MDHDDYDAVIVDCKNYGYQYYSDTLLIKPLIGVSNRIRFIICQHASDGNFVKFVYPMSLHGISLPMFYLLNKKKDLISLIRNLLIVGR